MKIPRVFAQNAARQTAVAPRARVVPWDTTSCRSKWVTIARKVPDACSTEAAGARHHTLPREEEARVLAGLAVCGVRARAAVCSARVVGPASTHLLSNPEN